MRSWECRDETQMALRISTNHPIHARSPLVQQDACTNRLMTVVLEISRNRVYMIASLR